MFRAKRLNFQTSAHEKARPALSRASRSVRLMPAFWTTSQVAPARSTAAVSSATWLAIGKSSLAWCSVETRT
jgi:hypothetical protein